MDIFDELKKIEPDLVLDEDGDYLPEFHHEQKAIIKAAAEVLNSLGDALGACDYYVVREFTSYLNETSYWNTSSFMC